MKRPTPLGHLLRTEPNSPFATDNFISNKNKRFSTPAQPATRLRVIKNHNDSIYSTTRYENSSPRESRLKKL